MNVLFDHQPVSQWADKCSYAMGYVSISEVELKASQKVS